jgi:hypothetical protein
VKLIAHPNENKAEFLDEAGGRPAQYVGVARRTAHTLPQRPVSMRDDESAPADSGGVKIAA